MIKRTDVAIRGEETVKRMEKFLYILMGARLVLAVEAVILAARAARRED